MKTEKDKMITREILLLFEETFRKVEGFYLDKGTSLFETIQDLSAAEASKKNGENSDTVAGHIFHMTFYIKVLQEYIIETRTGKTDWNESWVVTEVNEGEWDGLKRNLEDEYGKLKDFVNSIEEWNDGDYFGGVLSILNHCSFHLGSLRQLLANF